MSDVSNSKYVGKWPAVSVGAFSNSGDLSIENVLSLNADGTASYASGDEVIEYKWRETGDGVYLECLGDKADLKFTDDGPDKLKTTIMFFVTLSFKRIK